MKQLTSSRGVVVLACLVSWFAGVQALSRSPADMASAADAFLKGLTPEQRQLATFPVESAERLHWGFVPTEMFPRNGLTVKTMTEPQRALARKLLQTGLSQRGYLTATSIMDLETILGVLESAGRSAEPRPGNPMARDPERYYFSVFGTPAVKGVWGWRVEGHHISLNFTIVNGSLVAATPAFFGSNPAEVREGPKKGLRILAMQEDTARALVLALDEAQRAKAIIAPSAPSDIATMNNVDITPLSPAGIAGDGLTSRQRDLLMQVVEAYTGEMANDVAEERIAKIRKAGVEKIAFAWAGASERGKKHYYRVQGPTFLIEYDNTQNDGNHIHSVWRDFDGDFGRDLLREHLKSSH
jgi:hypothetical protein